MRTISFSPFYLSPFDGMSMIIRDFSLFRALLCPNKTDPELLINPYAVLSLPISFEALQIVPGRYPQGTDRNDSVELIQFSPGDLPEAFWAGSPRFL